MAVALRGGRTDAGHVSVLGIPRRGQRVFCAFLHALRTDVPDERVGIVLDNAPSHRSGQVVWPDGFIPLRLPPYSPELNPAKQIFRHLRKRLANQVFDDVAALHAALTQALAELWTWPQVVMRLTAYPWWAQAMQVNMPLAS